MVNNLFIDKIKYAIYPNRKNLVFTCDVLKEIQLENLESELYFLVGQDQYELITTWNDYEYIDSVATIVCYKRGNKPLKRINDRHIILNGPEIVCSSSNLREEIVIDDVGEKNFNYIKEKGLYIQTKIKSYMTQRRYEHTFRVLNTIIEIANANNFSDEDVLRCQTAALLHDIAKKYSDQELRTIISNDELALLPTYHCAHGLAGARIAQKDFGVTDQKVLDAIENHVIFKDINSTNNVAKALFLADKLEPARTEADIPDRAKLLNKAKENFETAFKLVYKLNGDKY